MEGICAGLRAIMGKTLAAGIGPGTGASPTAATVRDIRARLPAADSITQSLPQLPQQFRKIPASVLPKIPSYNPRKIALYAVLAVTFLSAYPVLVKRASEHVADAAFGKK